MPRRCGGGWLLLPPFALDPPGLRRLALGMALATLIAGVGFLVLPAQIGFPRPEVVKGHQLLYHWLYRLDGPRNLVPSLHVAYSTLVIAAIAEPSRCGLRQLLRVWLVALCGSVVLVHQHHLLDVLSGFGLGFSLHAGLRSGAVPPTVSGRRSS